MRAAAALTTLSALLFAMASPHASAQQALGRVGAGCAALNAQNQLSVALTQTVPAGAVVIASIAARGAATGNLSITDPAGDSYVPVGGARPRARGAAAVNLTTRTAAALPLGAVVTVRLGQADTGAVVCAALLAFTDLGIGLRQLHSPGGKSVSASNALDLNLDRAGNGVPQALVAAFALNGDPGSVTASGTTQVQPTVCSAGNTLCLVGAYDLSSTTGTMGVSLGTAVAVDWTGDIAGLYRDSMFANGYE